MPDALEFTNFDGSARSNAHVDLETAHVYWVTDEIEDLEELPDDIEASDRFLMLPDKRDLKLGRNLAFSFAEEFLLDDYENVFDCVRKKGVYDRFKDPLDRLDALTQWHDYEAKQTEIALREWCSQNAIQLADPTQT